MGDYFDYLPRGMCGESVSPRGGCEGGGGGIEFERRGGVVIPIHTVVF